MFNRLLFNRRQFNTGRLVVGILARMKVWAMTKSRMQIKL